MNCIRTILIKYTQYLKKCLKELFKNVKKELTFLMQFLNFIKFVKLMKCLNAAEGHLSEGPYSKQCIKIKK